MKPTSHDFKSNAHNALHDVQLQSALAKAGPGFVNNRRQAIAALPEFEELRTAARTIKEHALAHLDEYLQRLETQLQARGGHVHWARTPEEARRIIVDLCRESGATRIAKGKSMVGEEIALNQALEQAGLEPIETDLGEYILQLAHEPPSHIIAPAVHKTRGQIADLFREQHARYGLQSALETVPEIVDQARQVMRDKFISADVGITGANFLIAETGSTVIVTNEGNGDLSATLPGTHIVVTSLEKIVPTLEDVSVLLRLLARSATGQDFTAYTTFFTGPRRESDVDGPEQFHVVLLDNGRSDMLGNEFHDMLRCIRCGACLNHCPIYTSVGGHAYGWVYPGPMGSVLTPLMVGLREGAHLPNASTLCGRCQEVCPMSIPLPQMLRAHREHEFREHITATGTRAGLRAWAFLARRPALYRVVTGMAMRVLSGLGGRAGRLRKLPLASGWTAARDLPAPQGQTFVKTWQRRKRTQGTGS